PGADRETLYRRYGVETAPLNAKGVLVTVDGRPFPLECLGFDLTVEEHPRYTFHLATALPRRGRLVIQDTNYTEARGASRLALRAEAALTVAGDDLSQDVNQIPLRPTWLLSDLEERRTRQVEVDFQAIATTAAPRPPTPSIRPLTVDSSPETASPTQGLSRLLDRAGGSSVGLLWLLALTLGIAHAVQPGHGKTLIAAATAGGRGRPLDGVLLALVTTLVHFGSVLVIALGLWATRSTRYADWNSALARSAGFTIAAVGLWRVGRHLAGYGEHDGPDADPGGRGLLGLGVAGGLVPCWDAILLIVLAEAMGRLGLGLILLTAFSLGMAVVLIAVALAASRLRRSVMLRNQGANWGRRLGLASGLVLTLIGLVLLG
ncbi:MAG: ABC transporter permease, partial [Isosphaeraceae bacterium]